MIIKFAAKHGAFLMQREVNMSNKNYTVLSHFVSGFISQRVDAVCH